MILDTNALSAFVDGDRSVGEVLRFQRRTGAPSSCSASSGMGLRSPDKSIAFDGTRLALPFAATCGLAGGAASFITVGARN